MGKLSDAIGPRAARLREGGGEDLPGEGAIGSRFRLVALVEVGLFLAAALAVDGMLLDGDRFWSVSPHPFWLAVLLPSIQYGSREGLVAALLATAALLVGNIREPTIDEDVYGYFLDLTALPVMWLLTAVIVGELRNRQILERNTLRARVDEADRRNAQLTDNYHRLDRLRENLEVRVAGQMRTVLSTYEAAKALEHNGTGPVLSGIVELVRTLLEPAKFSVFLRHGEEIRAEATEGWSADEPLPRRYARGTSLFDQVIGGQNTVSVTDRWGAAVLEDDGVIAGPLITREGEVLGMLKIEDMRFLQLNATALENFRVLCEWCGNAYGNALVYEKTREGSVVNAETNMLSEGFYGRQVMFLTALARRVGFHVTAIKVSLTGLADDDHEGFIRVARAVSEAVETVLRTTDMVFDRLGSARNLEIVLPNTPPEGAQIAADKLLPDLRARLEDAGARDVRVEVAVTHLFGPEERS